MTTISYTDGKELAKKGERIGQAPSNWNGAYGLQVDGSFRLADGSVVDLICRHGWLYEARLYTQDEVTALSQKCPQNVKMEWGSGY